MAKKQKKLYTFQEIANELGVHRQTLWRKTRHLKPFLSQKGQRKRFYTQEEKELLESNMYL